MHESALLLVKNAAHLHGSGLVKCVAVGYCTYVSLVLLCCVYVCLCDFLHAVLEGKRLGHRC